MDNNTLIAKVLESFRRDYQGSAIEFKKLEGALIAISKALQAPRSDLKVSMEGIEVIQLQGKQGPAGKDGVGKEGKEGKQGIPGLTPKKGVNYFTPNEIKEFLEKATPKKGKHYLTLEEIKQFKEEVTPKKGESYYTDKDIKEIIVKVKNLIPKPKQGKQGPRGLPGTPAPLPDINKIAEIVKISITEKEGQNIVQAINAIKTADNKFKIDAKHIKGLKPMDQGFLPHGGPRVTVSTTPPSNPNVGDIWVDIS